MNIIKGIFYRQKGKKNKLLEISIIFENLTKKKVRIEEKREKLNAFFLILSNLK